MDTVNEFNDIVIQWTLKHIPCCETTIVKDDIYQEFYTNPFGVIVYFSCKSIITT